MTEFNPENDPDDYEVDPSEAGEPNDAPQDADVPEVEESEFEEDENNG